MSAPVNTVPNTLRRLMDAANGIEAGLLLDLSKASDAQLRVMNELATEIQRAAGRLWLASFNAQTAKLQQPAESQPSTFNQQKSTTQIP